MGSKIQRILMKWWKNLLFLLTYYNKCWRIFRWDCQRTWEYLQWLWNWVYRFYGCNTKDNFEKVFTIPLVDEDWVWFAFGLVFIRKICYKLKWSFNWFVIFRWFIMSKKKFFFTSSKEFFMILGLSFGNY